MKLIWVRRTVVTGLVEASEKGAVGKVKESSFAVVDGYYTF